MTTYLLDVNLLLALSDPMHIHHEVAHRWFAGVGSQSWATCPLTENGYARVASHPSYPNRPGDVGTVVAILRRFCAEAGHQFWVEDVTIRELLAPDLVVTRAHITDVYLLGLAVHNGGKLATLDHRVPVPAVQGGTDAIEIISV